MLDQIERIYAVGDVHGMHDLMLQLLAKIDEHAPEGKPYAIVFLGDYVDRGPKSRQVVAKLKELVLCPTERRVVFALAGNHEQMMLEAFACDEKRPGNAWGFWIKYGGWATLESYKGVPDYVIEDHMEWMKQLPCILETPGQVFVHAGLRPGVPISEQSQQNMLWIRDWQDCDYDFGKHVVYGHSIQDMQPIRYLRSTGIDTGACHGGGLTATWFNPQKNSAPNGFIRVYEHNEKIEA